MKALIVLWSAAMAFPAFAHDTVEAGAPWQPEGWIVAVLGLSAVIYGVGAYRLSLRLRLPHNELRRRHLLFICGWLTVAAAAASPLHEAGERSFTMHMIEHELLMVLAAPLLVLARPFAVLLFAFPRRLRARFVGWTRISFWRWAWRELSSPVAATALQAVALWVWHAPRLFDLALDHESWHIVQHLCFFFSALLFWESVLRLRTKSAAGLSAICLFATSLIGGALGALMAFSQSPWYAGYMTLGMTPFGLSPVEDQQLAGLIMWIPGGIFHAGAAFALIWQILSKSERGSPSLAIGRRDRATLWPRRLPVEPAVQRD